MKYITDSYIPNTFTINSTIIEAKIIPILDLIILHFNNNYKELIPFVPSTRSNNPQIDKYFEYLRKNQTSILKYKFTSPLFVPNYILMMDNKDIINQSHNILCFNENYLEAVLYYKTIISEFGSETYHINSLNDVTIDKLKRVYSGENIQVTKLEDYHQIVDIYKTKSIDLVILDSTKEPLHYILVVLSTLTKGGHLIIQNNHLGIYLQNMLHILAKYFRTIRTYKMKILNETYFICEDFSGKADDLDVLEVGLNFNYKSDPKIVEFVEIYDKLLSETSKKQIEKLDGVIVDQLSYDFLIKYYENTIEREHHKIIQLCSRYKLALIDSYVHRYDKAPNPLTILGVYQPIKLYGLAPTESKLDISVNKNKIDLARLEDLTSYININKIGIDT